MNTEMGRRQVLLQGSVGDTLAWMRAAHPTHSLTREFEGVVTFAWADNVSYGCFVCKAKVNDVGSGLNKPCLAATEATSYDDAQQLRRIADGLDTLNGHLAKIVQLCQDRFPPSRAPFP